MSQVTRVLLLTTEPAIRNIVEQVCLIDGHTTVTAATVEEAHALTAQRGGDAFALAVIDTAALGGSDQQQQQMVLQLWQAWRVTYPDLPLVFVGTMFQNDAFPSQGANNGGFLRKPFGPFAFADIMRTFLPGR